MNFDNMTREELIAYIKQLQGETTAANFAQTLAISPQYLSDVYNGHRQPGETILKALGAEKQITYKLNLTVNTTDTDANPNN